MSATLDEALTFTDLFCGAGGSIRGFVDAYVVTFFRMLREKPEELGWPRVRLGLRGIVGTRPLDCSHVIRILVLV